MKERYAFNQDEMKKWVYDLNSIQRYDKKNLNGFEKNFARTMEEKYIPNNFSVTDLQRQSICNISKKHGLSIPKFFGEYHQEFNFVEVEEMYEQIRDELRNHNSTLIDIVFEEHCKDLESRFMIRVLMHHGLIE